MDIEEDVKKFKELQMPKEDIRFKKARENILKERKQDKESIKMLKEDNMSLITHIQRVDKENEKYEARIKELEKITEDWRTHCKYMQIDIDNSIPKQGIQDKIDRLKNILSHYDEYTKLNILEKVNVDLLNAKIQSLQELLENKGE